MNVKRFTARTSREALAMVRHAFGEDAVVLSTRPGADGVEVLAMAPEGMQQLEAAADQTGLVRAPSGSTVRAPSGSTLRESSPAPSRPPVRAAAPALAPAAPPVAAQRATAPPHQELTAVDQDVQTLGMSTLTFQDYVRERMLKRRQSELDQEAASRQSQVPPARMGATMRHDLPVLREEIRLSEVDPKRVSNTQTYPHTYPDSQAHAHANGGSSANANANAQRDHSQVLSELRSMKSLIEERFGMLAFMEKLQRDPRQAELAQKLLDTGLSPALIRKVVQGLPSDVSDAMAWAASVLERNLHTDEGQAALEDTPGVFALIGSTGVGKTTSTAKIAAAFATRHAASQLGLITLDAYRVAAHEQLRTYGRILGVPVHTAHDRASLEDLLELLSAKKMVLIDTAGMAQRDTRTRELLEMLSHPSIQKLLVINAAAQGETVEDVMVAYGASSCHGVIVSKLDEAVKLGPALDAVIRHKCRVVGVANGQRVPEDWHRLSAQALVQRVMRGGGSSSWRLDASEVNLLFAGRHAVDAARATSVASAATSSHAATALHA